MHHLGELFMLILRTCEKLSQHFKAQSPVKREGSLSCCAPDRATTMSYRMVDTRPCELRPQASSPPGGEHRHAPQAPGLALGLFRKKLPAYCRDRDQRGVADRPDMQRVGSDVCVIDAAIREAGAQDLVAQ
jgi:hypothetical protein